MRALRRIVLGLVLLGGICAAVGYGFLTASLSAARSIPDGTLVYIEPGSSVRKIAQQLEDAGIIGHAGTFALGARLARAKGGLKAGEYALPPRVSARDVIALLQSGKTHQRRLTIAEGLMAFEIVDIINAADGLTGTIDAIPAEGSLLPETYHYTYGTTRQQIIDRMQKSMRDALAQLWDTRAENLPLNTPAEAVTLASIVEKETGVASERPKVAGVFINRLRVNMPLQSDPTTIYAITEGKTRLDRPLYRRDLNIQSPYNTYYAGGLPPGPIANPGRASLAAVLNPETHGYFYFVADGTGGHAFGTTLQEHSRNVSKWRQIQRDAKTSE